MVAAGGGNVERDIIFKLKAEVDSKAFQALSRFGKAATQIQTQIDQGVQKSTKSRISAEEKAAKAATREREKAFKEEQKLLAKAAKLIQKKLDDETKAVEKAAKEAQRAREKAAKETAKQRAQLSKQFERDLKAEEKAIQQAARQAEALQEKGEKAAMRFRGALSSATAGALQLGRGLAFVGIAGEEDLQKVVGAVLRIQGAFDIVKGGVQIFSSLAVAQKSLETATKAATAAQVAQNTAQAAGTAVGAGAAKGIGGLGAVVAAAGAAPVATIAVGAAAVVGAFALFSEDFRQGLGEFLGILENENERARKALQKRIELDRREVEQRIRLQQIQTRGVAQQARLSGRRQAVAAQFGVQSSREAAERTLAVAETRATTAGQRAEAFEPRVTRAQTRETQAKAVLKSIEDQIDAQKRIIRSGAERGRQGESFLVIIEKEVKATGKIEALEKRIAGAKGAVEFAVANTNNALAEQKGIVQELVDADEDRLSAQTAVGDAIRQEGEKQVKNLRERVTERQRLLQVSERSFDVAKTESEELEKQRKTQEQQFGLLSRSEQRQRAILAEKLAAGEKLTKRQLIAAQPIARGALQEEFERQVRAQGGRQLERIEAAQRLPEGIEQARFGAETRAREVQAAETGLAQAEKLLEEQLEKNKADLAGFFAEKIDPVFKDLTEAIATSIEIAVQKAISDINKRTVGENSTNREGQ